MHRHQPADGPGTLGNHIESVRQVALADRILITKLDLIDPAKASDAEAALTARLRAINPAAEISRIDDPVFDVGTLLRSPGFDPTAPTKDVREWLNAAAYEQHDAHEHAYLCGDHGHHHHHSPHDRDIASFCFVREAPIPREALRLLLDALQQNLGPNLLRVKGIIHVTEEPERPAVIQCAQHLLHNLAWLDRWPDADHRSKIVFITQGYERAEVEDMIAILDRVAMRTAAARARAQSSY